MKARRRQQHDDGPKRERSFLSSSPVDHLSTRLSIPRRMPPTRFVANTVQRRQSYRAFAFASISHDWPSVRTSLRSYERCTMSPIANFVTNTIVAATSSTPALRVHRLADRLCRATRTWRCPACGDRAATPKPHEISRPRTWLARSPARSVGS